MLKVVIRTNGGKLTVNAENDIVNHYNEVQTLDIQAVDLEHSYHEFGKVGYATIAKGHFVAEAKSEIKAIVNEGTKDDVKIDKDSSATVEKAFTIDNSAKLTEHGGNVSLDYLEATDTSTVEEQLEEIKHDAEAEYLAIIQFDGNYYLNLSDILERCNFINGIGYQIKGTHTMTLLRDVEDIGIIVGKDADLTIDLNGNNLVLTQAVGSSGTINQCLQTIQGSHLTIKNGTLKCTAGLQAIYAHGEFRADNVVFDFENREIAYYSGYTGDNAIYNGIERGILLCSGNAEFNNCTLKFPSASIKGLLCSIDTDKPSTKTILNNTVIEGYISIDDKDASVLIDNNSSFTGSVVSYLGGDTIVNETTSNPGYTTYKCAD